MAFAEQLASHGDTHGLLFGVVADENRTVITDNGSTEVLHTVVDIQVFVQQAFFDGNGCVDEELVTACIKRHQNHQLLGWFAFRANSPLRPSLRELAVHAGVEKLEALRRRTSGKQTVFAPLFAMLTTSCTKNASTHSLDYRFVRREGPQEPLISHELSITNSREDSQAEYGALSGTSFLPSGVNIAPLHSLQYFADVTTNPGLEALESYSEALHVHIDALVDQLIEVEKEELRGRAELEALRERVALASTS